MSKDSNWTKLFISLASVAVTTLCGHLIGWNRVGTFLWHVWTFLWHAGVFLIQPVSVPLILLAVMALILLVVFWGWVRKHMGKVDPTSQWLQYKEAVVFGVRWTWDWDRRIDGKWVMENPVCYCNKCQMRLVPRHNMYQNKNWFECLNCKVRYCERQGKNHGDTYHHLDLELVRRIETGEFKDPQKVEEQKKLLDQSPKRADIDDVRF